MGLYRTALRLATLEALAPAALLGTAGPWPTLACDRVFDSRIDPIEDLTCEQHKAVVVVYTENDIGYAGQHRGGPPFRREVELVFEISQIAAAPSAADPSVFIAGIPQTDPELEASLDRIEYEIGQALFFNTFGATITQGMRTRTLWRWLTGEMVTDPRSAVHRDSEENARLAMRSICWKVQVPDDHADPLPSQALTGFDRLPEPLKSIAKALPASSYGAQVCAGLAADIPTMPLRVPLNTVGINTEIVRPGAPRTGTPNLSVTVGNLQQAPSRYQILRQLYLQDAGATVADQQLYPPPGD